MLTAPLTQTLLKELLHYNPVTGIFTWISKPNRAILLGSVAGHKETITGYMRIRINKKAYAAHQLAFLYMLGEHYQQIDHINHIKTDNRWENLRLASTNTNNKNKSLGKNNKTGLYGVYWQINKQSWKSSIRVNKHLIYLGSSKDFFEACCLRKSAEVKHSFHINHGKQLNNISF